jgi:hypothetical protein
MKNHKQSFFDFEVTKGIIGGVLLIAIPLLLVFVYTEYFSGEPCDRDCEYYRENQPDLEPAPTDLNGDGTITRDEAEGL